MLSYDEQIRKIMQNAKRIEYSKTVEDQIYEQARKIKKKKKMETHHKKDPTHEVKRFATGLLGEMAVGSLLGISILDFSIGNSADYNVPDVPGFQVGIKTAEYGKWPIIFKENDYAQIMCLTDKERRSVYVLGLATPEILNACQDESLILCPNLRRRGTKTAFCGLDQLKPISSLLDLEAFREPEPDLDLLCC